MKFSPVFFVLLLEFFDVSGARRCKSKRRNAEELQNKTTDLADQMDYVHPSIAAERDRLQALPRHFVGKIDALGTLQHEGKKILKPERVKNPNYLVWNCQMKVSRGILPTDPPEKIKLPSNIEELAKYGKSCLKSGKTYPPLHGSYSASEGPQKEGLLGDDFEPCSDRVRGKAAPRSRKLGTAGSRRFKRSESYTYPSMLWKRPIIPYVFDPSVSEEVHDTITDALGQYGRSTCLTFFNDHGETQRNYSHIVFKAKGGSCSTDRLGPNPYPPYATTVDVSTCGKALGNVIHEIAHALGLSHTQKRVDRDKSVKVYLPNIAESWASQFELDSPNYFDEWGVPYYYDSIMHYFPYAATRNGLMTICPLDPLMEVVMGQREGLAFGDISLINRIYCQESCFNRDDLRGMQFFGNNSRTISGRLCQNWSTQNPHKHKFTSLGDHNSCRNPDGWDGGPWCYTTDPTVRYEPCFSPCESLKNTSRPAPRPSCKGWCYNGGYHDKGNCRCICPRHTNGEYCENRNDKLLYPHIRCGGKIDLKKIGEKATLKSPQYPNNYTDKTYCVWWIQSPNDTHVQLTVNDFSMEIPDSTGCYDFLEIRPSICAAAIERPEKMRFCGNSLARGSKIKQLHSDDNNMVLKFYSDDTENDKGFSITAKAISA